MNLNKHLQIISVVCIIITSVSVNDVMGQSKRDCRKILKTKIDVDTTASSVASLYENFKAIIRCKCDSTDYQVIFEKNKISGFAYQLLGLLIIDVTQTCENPNNITYNDLLLKLQRFISSNEYLLIRQYTLAYDKLSCKYPNLETWSEDSSLLIQMGSNPEQIKELKNIIIESDYTSWAELLNDYSDSKNKNEPERENQMISPDSGKTEIFKGLYAYESYETGMQKSQSSGKPVLLYFSGYGCVNCREIEAAVLLSSSIKDVINTKFEFVRLLVDDRTSLPLEKVHFSKVLNKEIKTIGQQNSELQIQQFGVNAQPFFAIIDAGGNTKSTQGYTRDKSEFLIFLNSALQ